MVSKLMKAVKDAIVKATWPVNIVFPAQRDIWNYKSSTY